MMLLLLLGLQQNNSREEKVNIIPIQERNYIIIFCEKIFSFQEKILDKLIDCIYSIYQLSDEILHHIALKDRAQLAL